MLIQSEHMIPAGHGLAVPAGAGDTVEVTNVVGTQVADFWCLSADDPSEWLSMSHCREVLQRIHFTPGDTLISNRYHALLEIVSDSSGIMHDTLIAACSSDMYRYHGIAAEHRSCVSNFFEAIGEMGLVFSQDPPQPWNLFMVAPVDASGTIAFERPPYVPNGKVSLKVLRNVIVVVSSCPDDVYPTNGGDGTACELQIAITPSAH